MITKLHLIKKGSNKKGKVIAISINTIKGNVSYGVWTISENYCGMVRGGISREWCYIKKGITLIEAEKIFNRRTKK